MKCANCYDTVAGFLENKDAVIATLQYRCKELEATIKTLKAENALPNDAINEDKALVAYAKELEDKLKVARGTFKKIHNGVASNVHAQMIIEEAPKKIGNTK